MASAVACEVQNLSAQRDGRLLFSNLSFQLKPGQLWQVEGMNGSGKTTLLRILAGLSDDYAGVIQWGGVAASKARLEMCQNLLYIGHLPAIKLNLTAEENLRWLQALHQPVSAAQVERALGKVGLRGYEDVPCHQLSAGQQRRVALARLHLAKQPLWILDEPFTAIDRDGVGELETLLLSHVQAGGTVVVTTHHRLGVTEENVQRLRLDDAGGR